MQRRTNHALPRISTCGFSFTPSENITKATTWYTDIIARCGNPVFDSRRVANQLGCKEKGLRNAQVIRIIPHEKLLNDIMYIVVK